MSEVDPVAQAILTAFAQRSGQFAGVIASDVSRMLAQRQPPHQRAPYHRALKAASRLFQTRLCPEEAVAGTERVVVHLLEEVDVMRVDGYDFSQRHFARNYESQFARDTQEHYRALGATSVMWRMEPDGSSLTLELTWPPAAQ